MPVIFSEESIGYFADQLDALLQQDITYPHHSVRTDRMFRVGAERCDEERDLPSAACARAQAKPAVMTTALMANRNRGCERRRHFMLYTSKALNFNQSILRQRPRLQG
ncbi:hypothetical protein I6F35_34310 [Bradyrhizobium sp. BRP22]|uniref:hypothetical protein n=1 Tax=Bradyrhizobium sp. BRP22 TaxID=2793821 RepID=UPI001CD678B5|nr:hypothetical protein [Bradyrhizobium sp. BRP22]MCA1458202.1 hypothetical protein [Bradyrhizobium sp. BRP22]